MGAGGETDQPEALGKDSYSVARHGNELCGHPFSPSAR